MTYVPVTSLSPTTSIPWHLRASYYCGLVLLSATLAAAGQSTLGGISGTVQDPTGAVVPNVVIRFHRVESNTDFTATSDAGGNYAALNVAPGHYDISASTPGFAPVTAKNLLLETRQQLRFDIIETPGGTSTAVSVNADEAGLINTQNAQISAALSPQAVIDLPGNYRGAGSTSPVNLVQALPGVQPDSGSYPPAPSTHPAPQIRFSIQGGLPSQTETTADGISAQNQTSNNIQGDAFPSAESIAEIRVDGVGNNAEYGQPGEITIVTKSGTNKPHGSIFEYLQNQFLDATPFGTDRANKPHKVANDFGVSFGGPLNLGRLYNGHDKTFVFGAYEGLRYPQSNVVQAKVPTVLMKQGNFSQETTTPINNPFKPGTTYANNQVPINAASAKFLSFYPDPNIDANLSLQAAIADKGYNYLSTRRDDIQSNQFDVRVDQNLGAKASLFARYTFKNVSQVQTVDLALPNNKNSARYRIFASSFNYILSPKLVNELRFGFTLEQDGAVNPFDGAGFTTSTGLNVLSVPAFFNGIPHLNFADGAVQSIGLRLGYNERSRIFQYVDNLTYQVSQHTLRFGADVRHLQAHTEAGGATPSINYGNFFFDPNNSATGNEFADFLVGVPYQSQSNNIRQDNDGTANAFAFYVQDNWKATPNLNFNFGLRYEYHPALSAANGLAGNFDPSIARTGRLIFPAGAAGTLDPQELANVNACPTPGVTNPYANGAAINGVGCTPVVTNVQAGLPAGLRTSPLLRVLPRVGFAYRPFGNEKTAIRGGAGYYNITTTGALFYAIAQTLQQNFQTFTNAYTPAGPIFAFPNTSASNQFAPAIGSLYFYSAIDTHWHDPYSLQTDFSLDHDFSHNLAARMSYIGMHTWHLVWQPQFNQLARSTTRRSSDAPASDYPFPNFYQITDRNTAAQADYKSLQVEVHRRMSGGLAFSSTYTFAKNLSDNQGSYANFSAAGFVDEQGGYSGTDSYDRHLDHGNVAGTRKHRSLTTAIYEFPMGHGRRYGANMGRVADLLAGGWQTSNILLWQSGPFLTAYLPAGAIDPSGTGSGTAVGGAAQRPDMNGKPNTSRHDRNHWFNNEAFACPGRMGYSSLAPVNGVTPCDVGTGTLPIGRYGTESVGALHGPGTVSLSSGLSKTVNVVEGLHLRIEGTFTNVLNHTNLADPVLDVTQPNFGQITQARGSDFGGNRTGQLSLRLEF